MKQVSKLLMLLALCLSFPTVASSQSTEKRASSLSRQLKKHHFANGYEKSAAAVQSARATLSAGEPLVPLVFKDRVWFPGEWEEVKAVVVSPRYEFLVPDHQDDSRYSASQIVKNWGDYYYQENKDAKPQHIGTGPCLPKIDVETADAKVFLYIMDGIQKGGAEAWVRIEEPEDEQLVRTAMTNLGLQTDKMQFFVNPGNAYWFRDCGPICFYYGDEDKTAMLDFFYYWSRPLDDELPSVLHRKFGIANYLCDLAWEGGNCLVDGVGGLITSTATYRQNEAGQGHINWDGKDPNTIKWDYREKIEKADIKAALSGLLGQRQLTVVPMLNYEGGTGHVDLYADAIDENSLLLAKMPDDYYYWTDYDIAVGNTAILSNKRSFFNRRYNVYEELPFPAHDDGSAWSGEEDYADADRTYANHLLCNNYVLQPCFSPVDENHMPTAEWDRANIERMKKYYPGYTFYCIDMRTFDGQGGSIHCVTKQIPADNPVRIIHKNIFGNVNPGDLTAIPFRAIITNKSGIESAKLIYRVNQGDWQTVSLAANGNSWSTTVALASLTGGQELSSNGIQVEYYIEATSNNGKTMRKPVNATYGAYYDFCLTTVGEYDSSNFDFETSPAKPEDITFTLDTQWLVEDNTTDASTGIVEVKSQKKVISDNVWYTIEGIRLGAKPSVKGIYICNGHKVIIH